MMQVIFVGVVAGLAASLLFMAPFGGTPFAVPLFVLTALPIAIAGFGWGVMAAAVAAVTATVGLLALVGGNGAAMFAFIFGGPASWAIAVATRQTADGEATPPGIVLAHTAAAVALGLVATGIAVGFDQDKIAADLTAALVELSAGTGSTPLTAEDVAPLVTVNVAAMPATVALLLTCMLVLDLWLAAKIAHLSGHLKQPGPSVTTTRLPGVVPLAILVAGLLAFVPGAPGLVAAPFAGALGGAVALTGLAVLHVITVGMPGRPFVLGAAYVLLFVSGLPIILFVLLGLADSLLNLRDRRPGGVPR